METGTVEAEAPRQGGERLAALAAVALPAAGFVLLLAAPGADVRWEHHPSHFWLVVLAAATTAALAYTTGDSADRRGDARLFWVSTCFLAAGGFLGLHALATPGIFLEASNLGFQVATPIGLVIASVFAAASASPASEEVSPRTRRRIRAGLVLLMVGWGVATVAGAGAAGPDHRGRARVRFDRRARAARRRALPLRRGALPRARARAAGAAAAGGGDRVLPARRGDPGDRVRAQLARELVGMAPADPGRVRGRRLGGAARVAGGALRLALHRRDRPAAGASSPSCSPTSPGFTAFAEGRDPREVSEMLNAYFEVAIPPVVSEHGGVIDQLIGDAILATFSDRPGEPDHALRAAHASLAIRDRTAALAERHPGWPRFRIGVNTGEAMVGVVGAGGGRSYTVIGDAVNTASRLEGEAPVGEVAISAATMRRLGDASVRRIGELSVKGKREPVEVFVLLGV